MSSLPFSKKEAFQHPTHLLNPLTIFLPQPASHQNISDQPELQTVSAALSLLEGFGCPLAHLSPQTHQPRCFMADNPLSYHTDRLPHDNLPLYSPGCQALLLLSKCKTGSSSHPHPNFSYPSPGPSNLPVQDWTWTGLTVFFESINLSTDISSCFSLPFCLLMT